VRADEDKVLFFPGAGDLGNGVRGILVLFEVRASMSSSTRTGIFFSTSLTMRLQCSGVRATMGGGTGTFR